MRRPVLRPASTPAPTHIYKDQRSTKDNIVWRAPKETVNPWHAEWNVLLDTIRNDKPQNEAKRAALSNLADLMGRAAVHTGQDITWDEMMASNFQFCPNIDQLTPTARRPSRPTPTAATRCPCPGNGPKSNRGYRRRTQGLLSCVQAKIP